MFLTDVIVELGYAPRDRVDEVINEARTAGQSTEQLLLEQNLIDADQLSRAIAERYGLPHVDLSSYHVDMGAANLLSVAAARRYQALPVGYLNPETLIVVTADPANVLAIDDIKMITGLSCQFAVAAADDIEGLIRRLNTLETAVTEAVDEEAEGELGEVAELRESAGDAPVVKLVYFSAMSSSLMILIRLTAEHRRRRSPPSPATRECRPCARTGWPRFAPASPR